MIPNQAFCTTLRNKTFKGKFYKIWDPFLKYLEPKKWELISDGLPGLAWRGMNEQSNISI